MARQRVIYTQDVQTNFFQHFYGVFWSFLEFDSTDSHSHLLYRKQRLGHSSKFPLLCSMKEVTWFEIHVKCWDKINNEQNFHFWVNYLFKFQALTLICCRSHFLDPKMPVPSALKKQCHPYLPTAVWQLKSGGLSGIPVFAQLLSIPHTTNR